jgi:hypothetical protein
MTRTGVLVLCLLFVSASIAGQIPPPEIGRKLPDPGRNRIAVRFAVAAKAITCKKFRLIAKVEGRQLIDGWFSGGFRIPLEAQTLARKEALELEFRCGSNRWHFTKVGERAFLPGWWWVGTDYPPFQETFQNWPRLQDAAWVRYLIVEPTTESGFTVFSYCPARLKDQKPGPCYVDD